MRFAQPPVGTVDGRPRQVGVEIEYQGLDASSLAECIRKRWGGTIERQHAFALRVQDSEFGTFRVELDSRWFKEQVYLDYLHRVGVRIEDTDWQSSLERALERVSSLMVPQELVTPPLPIPALTSLDEIRREMHELGARGTRDGVAFAFGVHFNPEAFSRRSEDALHVLQSFLLLYDGLVESMDLARRLGPFVSDFGEDYREQVLDNDYTPNWDTLILDYIRHNPTRNRALDLLPLFRTVRPDGPWNRVQNVSAVKARPTFHYRLPDCRIDEPDWSLADAWNPWVKIEEVACSGELREQLVAEYRATRDAHAFGHRSIWKDRAVEVLSS
ncbi:MAG: amidoligase family protein [Myxococcota bacterium]